VIEISTESEKESSLNQPEYEIPFLQRLPAAKKRDNLKNAPIALASERRPA
jgi:hypothetical protein